jgi:hypothetical protein
MSYGLNVYHSTGSLTYSSSDVTWNQVDFFQVSGGGSASNSYPIINGRDVLLLQMFINPPPLNRKALAHTLSKSGATINVSGGTEDVYVLVLMK